MDKFGLPWMLQSTLTTTYPNANEARIPSLRFDYHANCAFFSL